MERMGRQRAVESSTVLDQASEKVTSTRSRHEERVFEASQVQGAPDGWIGATPQLPHKRSVTIHSRLDNLRDERSGRLPGALATYYVLWDTEHSWLDCKVEENQAPAS